MRYSTKNVRWIYEGMILVRIVAQENTYCDRLKVVAKKLFRNTTTKIKQLILKFLMINTSTVVQG